MEPQSTGLLFLLLMGTFCVLLGCVAVARQAAVRVLAAALAFVPTRQPDVIVRLAPGGKHNMATWRALVPPLLAWMTPRLGYADRHPALAVARAAGRSARR